VSDQSAPTAVAVLTHIVKSIVDHPEDVTVDEARARAQRAIDDGAALERFRAMVEAQGGDPRVVDDPAGILPRAPVVEPLIADRSGTLAAVDALEIGLASSVLGAGRVRKDDAIDPAVGLVLRAKVGDGFETGDAIGEIHARSEEDAREAAERVLACLDVTDGPVVVPELIYEWWGPTA